MFFCFIVRNYQLLTYHKKKYYVSNCSNVWSSWICSSTRDYCNFFCKNIVGWMTNYSTKGRVVDVLKKQIRTFRFENFKMSICRKWRRWLNFIVIRTIVWKHTVVVFISELYIEVIKFLVSSFLPNPELPL